MVTFVSLVDALANCFAKSAAELSPDQQVRVNEAFANGSWDAQSAKARRDAARDWDRRNRPMTPEEEKRVEDHFKEACELDAAEDFWSTRVGDHASDAKVKRDELKAIRERKAELDAARIQLRGDDLSANTPEKPGQIETPEERRARLLATFETEREERGSRGALERIYVKEKALNSKADRSYIGKQIRKAKDERRASGAMAGVTNQLVVSGKRQR